MRAVQASPDRRFAHSDADDLLCLLPPLRLFIEAVKERPQKKGSTPANEQIEAAEDQRKDAVTVPDATEQAEEDGKWGKETITQKYLWPRMSKFFRDEDVILAETGTSAFGAPPPSPFFPPVVPLKLTSSTRSRPLAGVLDIPYPKTAIALAQVLWGAIGWSVGAMFGAATAARERKVEGRTILLGARFRAQHPAAERQLTDSHPLRLALQSATARSSSRSRRSARSSARA